MMDEIHCRVCVYFDGDPMLHEPQSRDDDLSVLHCDECLADRE